MGMMDIARAAVKQVTSMPGGFAVPITLVQQLSGVTVTVMGIHRKVYLSIDEMGSGSNTKRSYVDIFESIITDAGYPTRDANNNLILLNDFVKVADANGVMCNYIIREIYPDEALGNLCLILGDSEI